MKSEQSIRREIVKLAKIVNQRHRESLTRLGETGPKLRAYEAMQAIEWALANRTRPAPSTAIRKFFDVEDKKVGR